jgi:hypothetical protein
LLDPRGRIRLAKCSEFADDPLHAPILFPAAPKSYSKTPGREAEDRRREAGVRRQEEAVGGKQMADSWLPTSDS